MNIIDFVEIIYPIMLGITIIFVAFKMISLPEQSHLLTSVAVLPAGN